MRVVSFFNLSGGVGKTTLTKEVSYLLAVRGHRVLAIDMDPQGSLTTFTGLGRNPEKTTYDVLMKGADAIASCRTDTFDWGFDIVPANLYLAQAEMELATADMREFRLKKFLAQHTDYDFVLIDCPPSLGVLSYVALVASTHVVVPIQTEYKAFNGADLILGMLKRVKDGANPKLAIGAFVPTLFAAGLGQHQRTLDELQELKSIAPLAEPIPRVTSISDASEKNLPLAEFLFQRKRRSQADNKALVAIAALVDLVEGLANV